VLLGLGIEARVMIRIPCVRRGSACSGRGTEDRFVDAANAARAGAETPCIITTLRIGVAPADESGPANFLGSEQRIQREHPVASSGFEIRVGRKRLDLGTADQ